MANYIDDYPITEDQTFLTKGELMELMELSRSTIQRLMRKGMPYQRFSGIVLFDVGKVAEWLKTINYPPYDVRQKRKRRNKLLREKAARRKHDKASS